jgi:hypothetical protein
MAQQINDNVLITVGGNENLEKGGSPALLIQSHGSGNATYAVRVTNNRDGAGGRRFVISHEDPPNPGTDLLTIDRSGIIAVSGDIRLTGADCAEDFTVAETAGIEPGTVVIITEEGKLQKSCEAYDRKVAGVVSGGGNYRPGIVLGQQKGLPEKRLPIALVGKVFCNVDADPAPIGVGDLLTTSSTPGCAMKAREPLKAFGSVIGKALGSLDSGKGMIPILVALQ